MELIHNRGLYSDKQLIRLQETPDEVRTALILTLTLTLSLTLTLTLTLTPTPTVTLTRFLRARRRAP